MSRCNSSIPQKWRNSVLYRVKHVGKHYVNIYETSGASLVVFSITSVKSRFTTSPLAEVISMTVKSLKTIGENSLEFEHTKAKTGWQPF